MEPKRLKLATALAIAKKRLEVADKSRADADQQRYDAQRALDRYDGEQSKAAVAPGSYDLDALEKIALEAPVGPWEWRYSNNLYGPDRETEILYVKRSCRPRSPSLRTHIATFSPPLVMAMIAEIRTLRLAVETAKPMMKAKKAVKR